MNVYRLVLVVAVNRPLSVYSFVSMKYKLVLLCLMVKIFET